MAGRDRGGSDPPKRKRPGIGQTILRPDFQTKRAEVDTRSETAGQDPRQDAEIVDLRARDELLWRRVVCDLLRESRRRVSIAQGLLEIFEEIIAAEDPATIHPLRLHFIDGQTAVLLDRATLCVPGVNRR
jgi:hypothetical protein